MDVMIIGVQKAGTSTLQEMMKSDDRIRTHYSEEFGYFLDFDKRSYDEWIKSSFERERDSHELILGKCVDLFVDKKALMKLRKEFPKVKVVTVSSLRLIIADQGVTRRIIILIDQFWKS